MSQLLTSALALILAGNLLLPARWCCVMAAPASEPTAVSAAACPHCKQSPERKNSSVPCRDSSGECCIGKPVVKPGDDSAVRVDLASATTWTPAAGSFAAEAPIAVATISPAFESPPRHLLQCVWRC